MEAMARSMSAACGNARDAPSMRYVYRGKSAVLNHTFPSLAKARTGSSSSARKSARESMGSGDDVQLSNGPADPTSSLPSAQAASPAELFNDRKDMTRLQRIVSSQRFETCVGIVIFINFIVINQEADASARWHDASEPIPTWIPLANFLFLCIYIGEALLRFVVEGKSYFHNSWNMFDLVIIALGVLSEILNSEGASNVSQLRCFRSLRLLRAVRLLVSFRELWMLVSGFIGAFKTLMWAGILLFLLLTIWSVVAVENLHPLMLKLEEQGQFGSCDWCPKAFSSVMWANLTFFQIMTGDGWGFIARPLSEQHWIIAVFFVCIIMSTVLGVMNLITAVIVETAAEARLNDMNAMAVIRECEQREACTRLVELCEKIDTDRDGGLTLAELRAGILQEAELRQKLRIMDVSEGDLEVVFAILDMDGDGTTTYPEFATQLWKMKSSQIKPSLMILQHHIDDMRKEIGAHIPVLHEKLLNSLERIEAKLSHQAEAMEKRVRQVEENLLKTRVPNRSGHDHLLQQRLESVLPSLEEIISEPLLGHIGRPLDRKPSTSCPLPLPQLANPPPSTKLPCAPVPELVVHQVKKCHQGAMNSPVRSCNSDQLSARRELPQPPIVLDLQDDGMSPVTV